MDRDTLVTFIFLFLRSEGEENSKFPCLLAENAAYRLLYVAGTALPGGS